MTDATRYRVTGMDCPSCAAKIEKAVQSAGVEGAEISTATQLLKLDLAPGDARLGAVESAVTAAGYHLDRIAAAQDAPAAHLSPGYARALWIVIALNVGYGLVEMVAGFLAGSQALKADALDFLGDGLITFLGLLAIGWSLAWRARSALLQGLFLGGLGLAVIGHTLWRVFAQVPIEAALMGWVALVALAINIGAALVLMPHRAGDANVRAVWLFSRNDAIGNAAVVLAALMVGWTGSPWPDLLVAFIIAGLFLHAAQVIIRDSRRDLATARRASEQGDG